MVVFYKIKWQDIFAENIANILLRYTTFNIHIQTPYFTAFKNLYNLQLIPIWNKNTTGNNVSSLITVIWKLPVIRSIVYQLIHTNESENITHLLNTECMHMLIKTHCNYITGQKKSCPSFTIILIILLKTGISFSTAEQTYIPTWYSVP